MPTNVESAQSPLRIHSHFSVYLHLSVYRGEDIIHEKQKKHCVPSLSFVLLSFQVNTNKVNKSIYCCTYNKEQIDLQLSKLIRHNLDDNEVDRFHR